MISNLFQAYSLAQNLVEEKVLKKSIDERKKVVLGKSLFEKSKFIEVTKIQIPMNDFYSLLWMYHIKWFKCVTFNGVN